MSYRAKTFEDALKAIRLRIAAAHTELTMIREIVPDMLTRWEADQIRLKTAAALAQAMGEINTLAEEALRRD